MWRQAVESAQCTSASFRAVVTGLGMCSSMGSTGRDKDEAAAESFFSAPKHECVHRTVYANKAQARRNISRYGGGSYNSQRGHSALDCRFPNEVHYSYRKPSEAAWEKLLTPLSEIREAAH